MGLKDLHELAKAAKKNYTQNYKNKEIKLQNGFRVAFENYLQKKGDTIKYLDYSAEITINASKNKIFLPNQWFCISAFLSNYVFELLNYKRTLENIKETSTRYQGKSFWDEVKALKDQQKTKLSDSMRRDIEEYFKDDIQSIEYMTLFLLEYSWWNGSKTIDRADFFVSPVLNLLGVVNVAQAYIADIAYAIATDEQLRKESLILLQSIEKEASSVETLTGALNLIVYGAPGTGKSRYVEDSFTNITRVVFHSDYSYYDFIGCYKPSPVYKASDRELKLLSGEIVNTGEPLIDYRFVPGPFIETLVYALKDPLKSFTLLIEEINRANAASVFGDVFQLLDRDEVGNSEYKIKVSKELNHYFQSIPEITPKLADGLFIPSNMNIIATMNSADQGVFPLDSAFKRRWKFKYIPIIEEGFAHQDEMVPYCGERYKWKHVLKCINNRLKDMKVDEDRLIGQYFINMHEISDKSSMTSKLFVYLWDDVLRHKRSYFFIDGVRTYSELITAYEKDMDVLMILESLNSLQNADENSDDDPSKEDYAAEESNQGESI